MDRFKMHLGNQNNYRNVAIMQKSQKQVSMASNRLNASMIDRVHKARSGCSACGKKVM